MLDRRSFFGRVAKLTGLAWLAPRVPAVPVDDVGWTSTSWHFADASRRRVLSDEERSELYEAGTGLVYPFDVAGYIRRSLGFEEGPTEPSTPTSEPMCG